MRKILGTRLWHTILLAASSLLAGCGDHAGSGKLGAAQPSVEQPAVAQPSVEQPAVAQSAVAVATPAPKKEVRACAAWRQIKIKGIATFYHPVALATDGKNLYVSDQNNNRIRMIDLASGNVATLAGSGKKGMVDGSGPAAEFDRPEGIATDGKNVYVVDALNNRIRKISIATREVTTLADLGKQLHGTLTPRGIILAGDALYVADALNLGIRKIDIATGAVTNWFIPGAGGMYQRPIDLAAIGDKLYVLDGLSNSVSQVSISDGKLLSRRPKGFAMARGIASDGKQLFISEGYANSIKIVQPDSGAVSTLAGPAELGAGGNAAPDPATDGVGTAARFSDPAGMVALNGYLYVADSSNNRIRKIDLRSGQVSTLAGIDAAGDQDGISAQGAASGAEGSGDAPWLIRAAGISTDGGNLYVADNFNDTISRIDPSDGRIQTIAGTAPSDPADGGATDGKGTQAAFWAPHGLAFAQGKLYVADYGNHLVRMIDLVTDDVSTLAGTSEMAGTWERISLRPLHQDGVGSHAIFSYPRSLAANDKFIYVADYDNHLIRRVEIATRKVSTVAGSGTRGTRDGPGPDAEFAYPRGIALDGENVYVADTYNHKIRRIALATRNVTTLAGSGTEGDADGTGTAASFSYPQSVVVIGGNLYVSDQGNHAIRKIVIATGEVSTFAGTGSVGAMDGTAPAISFNQPESLATDGENLYVADSSNQTIRRINVATGAASTLVHASCAVVPAAPETRAASQP